METKSDRTDQSPPRHRNRTHPPPPAPVPNLRPRASRDAANRPPSARACLSKAKSPAPSRCISTARWKAHQSARQPRDRGPQRPGRRQHYRARDCGAGQGARQRLGHDRVDIRAEGSLNGDVAAARISIEDGAFFKGGIDIRKADAKQAQQPGVSGNAAATNSASSLSHEPAKVQV